jgi:hypothetical protein
VVHYEKFHRLSKDELDEIVRQYDDRTGSAGRWYWQITPDDMNPSDLPPNLGGRVHGIPGLEIGGVDR